MVGARAVLRILELVGADQVLPVYPDLGMAQGRLPDLRRSRLLRPSASGSGAPAAGLGAAPTGRLGLPWPPAPRPAAGSGRYPRRSVRPAAGRIPSGPGSGESWCVFADGWDDLPALGGPADRICRTGAASQDTGARLRVSPHRHAEGGRARGGSGRIHVPGG